MRLKDFMKMDVYKNADRVEYIGADGMELPCDEAEPLEYDVINHHMGSTGCLEIQLNTL